MSDSTVTASSAAGTPKVSKIPEAVIRIAGNSQDGIQAIGGFLARLAGRSEQEVMTFMTIPSTISGGPSIFQVRVGSGEVLSSGDEADVLLAFYQHSYDDHLDSLKKGGIVLYDSDHVTEIQPESLKEYHHIGVPISGLTVEAIGGTAKDKGKNIFALGLIAKMFNLNVPKLEKLITERFTSKDPSIAQNALAAFHAGYNYSLGGIIETFQFVESQKAKDRAQIVMNGDEIASVSMAIGASYAGRVAVTGSSGPGLSLKTEALGWAVMAEMPLVIVDVQRGGPSTGMPTNVEQSDLNIACFGGHGDSPRVVLAPADVEDCFFTAIEAVNIARNYSVPVIILTDQGIATRIEAFAEPDLEKVCQDISPDLSPVADHKPYDLSAPGGVTHHLAPGTRIQSGRYPIVTGLEHDELGHPTGAPKLHMDMSAKRRKKLQKLGAELPVPKVYGPPEGNVLLVGWGSTQGPIKEAVDRARAAGDSVSSLHIKYLNPLPQGLDNIFAGFNHVFVVEMNDEGLYGFGQLGQLLRARYCDPKIRAINKVDGLTWKVRDILGRAREAVSSGMKKL